MRTLQTAALALSLLAVPFVARAALVAAYGLNAQSGTSMADASGNSNTGTSNTTTRTTGKFGSARAIAAGSTGFINIGNGTTLRITGSMTVSAWIKPTSFTDSDAAVVSKRGQSGGFELDVTKDTGARTIGFKLTSSSGANMIRYGTTALAVNQWYHVAGVYNASAQTMDVYVNGVLDNGSQSGTITTSQQDFSVNVNFGRRLDGSSFFAGVIDEVRIYNTTLTQAQIQTDMNASVETLAADTTAPTVPTNFFASPTGTTSNSLLWTASTDYYGPTGYLVERCQGAGCSNFAQIGTVTDSPYSDTGLTPGATYRYRVRATDAAGNLSGYTSIQTSTTLATAPSGGRVGIYPFDEGTGANAGDLSDLHNPGIRNGPVWTANGKYGSALVWSVTNYLDINNIGMLQMTGSMTISAWINASSFPTDDAVVVSKRTGADNQGFQLDTSVDQGPRTIGFKLTTGAGEKMLRYGATALQTNTWYHVAGVYDAQAQTLNVYLNGVLDNGPSVGTVASSQMDRRINVNVGRRPGESGFEFLGTIDEVRIYNRTLTQAEIQSDMNTPASGGPAPDTIAPSAPSNLGATAASATQINLSWTASTDNVAVTGYLVERCQGAGCSNFAQIATPASTTFSDTNLTAATNYSYRVRATDAAANLSAYSNVASASTPAAGQAQMYFIHADHLNTTRLVQDQAGNTVWRWDQGEPFGNSVPNGDPNNTGVAFDFPLRFPGQYFDRETNLNYNYFRDCYDPVLGRYCESDPIGTVLFGDMALHILGSPGPAYSGLTSLLYSTYPRYNHLYAYVNGDPISLRDPSGLRNFLDECQGRYATCTPTQDPQGGTIGNYLRLQVCKGGIDNSCEKAPSVCCDQDRNACLGGLFGEGENDQQRALIAKCALEHAKCMAGGKKK
jgi:RHS repeat-associated protein